MSKMNSIPLLKKKSILITFFVLSNLCISENALSQDISTRDHWGRDFVTISNDKDLSCVVINFKIYDYHFGPANEDGYQDSFNLAELFVMHKLKIVNQYETPAGFIYYV